VTEGSLPKGFFNGRGFEAARFKEQGNMPMYHAAMSDQHIKYSKHFSKTNPEKAKWHAEQSEQHIKQMLASSKQGVAEGSLEEGVNDPHIFKAIAMIGPMGAGKSTIARQLVGGSGLRSLNLDNFNELMIKQGKVVGGNLTSDQLERSWQLTQAQKSNWVNGRLGLLIDGSGRNIEGLVNPLRQLEALGYDTMVILVNVSLETSLQRQQSRAAQQAQQYGTGRNVPADLAKSSYDQIQKNIPKLQQLYGNKLLIINNEGAVDLRQEKVIVDKFLSAPPSKPAAVQWIKSQGASQGQQLDKRLAQQRQQTAAQRAPTYAQRGVAEASSTDKQLAYWDGVAKEKKDKEREALKAKKAEHEKTPVGKAEKYWSKKDVAEGSGPISKTKALNALRKELMNSYEYMKCGNLEEFKQRLQWLSEGMLKNHMTGGKTTAINQKEIELYKEYRKKREQIQQGFTSQGVTEGSIKSTQQQLADAQQKLMDIISKANGEPPANDAEAKERQALFNKIKRLRTQVAGSRSEGVKEGKTNRINEVSPELARRASSVAKSRADALGKISDMGADDPGAQMYLGKSSKFDKYAAQKDAKQKQLDKINKLLDVGMSQSVLQKTAQQYGFDPKLIQTAVAQRTQKSIQPSGSISNVAAEPVKPSQSVSNEPAASGTDDQDLNLNLKREKGVDIEPAASATPNQTFKHGDKTRAARDMLDTIIDMYANQGISLYEIARRFNIDNRRVGDAIFKIYCNSDKEKYNELKQRHSEARMKKNNTNNTTEPEQAQTISQPTDNTAPAQTSDELNAVFAKLDADEEKIFDEIRKNKRNNHNIISYLVANSLGVSRTTFLEWLKYKLYKMINSGMTYTDASKKTGMSDERIKDYVDQYIRAQSDPEAARKELFAKLAGKHGVKRGTTDDEIIEIVDMYANRGMSLTEIARQFNMHPPTISYYIKTKYCQNNKNEIDKLKELHSEARRKKLKEPEQAQSISQATDTATTAQPSDELDSTSIDSEYRFAKLDANEEDIFHQMSQGQTTALIAKNLDVTNSTIIEWLRDKVYDMANSGMLITDISKKIGRDRAVVTKLIDMYFNTQPDPEAAKKEFNAKRLGKQGIIKGTTQEEMKTYRVVARKKELHLNLPLIKAANVEEARMQAWEMLEERGRNSNDYDVEEVDKQTYKASELPHSGKTPVYKIHDNSGKLLVKYVPHSEKFDYKNKGWFENPLRALRRYGMWYDTATDTVTQYDPLIRKHIKVDPGFKTPIDVTNGMPDRIEPDSSFSSREEVEFDDKTQKYIDDTTKKVTELLTKYPNLLPSEIGRRLGFDPMKKLHSLISQIITDVKRDMNL
jgi:DNA-binding CsgD family transcriptional regulator/adenylate kinase family enzyme